MAADFAYPPSYRLANTPTRLMRPKGDGGIFGGCEVYVKRDDEIGCLLSGNKVRKLEFFAADAIAQGADYLITSGITVSNHARTTAAVARELGMGCALVLFRKPGLSETPDGNLLLDMLLGAEVHMLDYEDRSVTGQHLAEFADDLRAHGHRPYIVPDGGSSPLGMMGLVKLAEELSVQIREQDLHPDAVVVAVGSGGTYAGLVTGARMFGIDCPIWGFSISRREERLRREMPHEIDGAAELYGSLPASAVDIHVTDAHLGPGYGITTPEEMEFIPRFSAATGIIVDPTYMGKVFLGVSKEIHGGMFQNAKQLIVIHTGGIFGLFPHREGFLFG